MRQGGIIVALAAVMILGTGTGLAQLGGTPDPGTPAGDYCGRVVSSGRAVPVFTRLDVGDGSVSGTYAFNDPVQDWAPERGVLEDCAFTGAGRSRSSPTV